MIDVICWLVEHGILKSEIDGKPTEFLLDLYKQKLSRPSEKKTNLNEKQGVMAIQAIPRLEPVYKIQSPLNEKKAKSTQGKTTLHYLKIIWFIFLSAFPKEMYNLLPG